MGDFGPRAAASSRYPAEQSDFVLGGLTVKPSRLLVQMGGLQREVQPRVMHVLAVLAQEKPEPVTREQLFERCWGGRIVSEDALNRCILQLRHLADTFSPCPFEIETIPRVGYRLLENPETVASTQTDASRADHGRVPPRVIVGAVSALSLVGAAWLLAGQDAVGSRSDGPEILVAGVDGASQQISRRVRGRLVDLQPRRGSSPILLGSENTSSGRFDYLVEVSGPRPGAREASAALLSAPERKVLWSSHFRADGVTPSDLADQLSYAIAGALTCAPSKRQAPHLLEDYVTGCTALSTIGYDSLTSARLLQQVVKESPKFAPGWASLLQAEIDSLGVPGEQQARTSRRLLARHAQAAQRIEADLPEALIAQARLASPMNRFGRLRLLDTAVIKNPDHAVARLERAAFLFSVGLVRDSLQDAQVAVQLAPSSLRVRTGYVYSLIMAGQLGAASRELSEVERLWPGVPDIAEVRFLLELRYGDPKRAEALLNLGAVELGASALHKSYLRARLEPTQANVEVALNTGRNMLQQYPPAISAHIQTLATFDRRDELFQLLTRHRIEDIDGVVDVIFRPSFARVHRDPRFMQVARRFGLLTFWRASGRWPDFCLAPDLPYKCRSEAAKLR